MDSNGALAQLQAQQAQAQNPNDILSNQRQQLGVDSAQQTVNGLRGAINNTTKLLQQVAPSVMGRTGSSLVTNAQASKQIQNEQAPISQNLSQEGTDYNQANSDLTNLQGQANQAAAGVYQGQQDKLSYLQNIYNTLYQKEQDAAKVAQDESDRQEQIREFNVQAAQAAKGSGGGVTLGGDTASSASSLPQGVSLKNAATGGSSGYNFNFGGSPVSAARFAQLSNGDLRNLLYNMGNSGDKTAAAALQALTKSGGKWTPQIQSAFPSLFWGT